MSTRRMTRETRDEWLQFGMWRPVGPGNEAFMREKGFKTRTVERYVTEWVEVVE